MLQQIFDLLTTATGNLAYHLVMAFSILGALQMAVPFRSEKPGQNSHSNRLIIGLACLLFLQFVQFILSGLSWQGVLDGAFWLPPVDRGVTLLSLVVVIWLWLLPEKDAIWDAATGILIVLLLVGLVFSVFWWRNQYPNLAYNSSWADFILQLTAIFLSISAGILLFVRRPKGWTMGLVMLGILVLGPVLHLLVPLKGGAYSGAVRAAQLAAFPLLFLIPYRWQEEKDQEISRDLSPAEIQPDPDAPNQFFNAETWKTLSGLAQLEPSQENFIKSLSILADLTGAQACLLACVSDTQDEIVFEADVDQGSGRNSEKFAIDAQVLPLVSAALRSHVVERLAVNAYSPDTLALAKVYRLAPVSDILFVPVRSLKKSNCGILLLFSTSLTNLSARQYSALLDLAGIVARILSHDPAMEATEKSLDQAKLSRPGGDLRIALEEIDHLRVGLAEAEQRIAALRGSATQSQPVQQGFASIENIIQDLRQPILSITNNADNLLGESVVSFNDHQRKRLERIRVSTERLNRLLNDLAQTVSSESRVESLSLSEINLSFLLARIVGEAKSHCLPKEILIRQDLPFQPLIIYSDYLLLEKALTIILQNAASVSPAGSTVQVSAVLEHTEGSPDFALIQVADCGGGIDLGEFSRGFVKPENGAKEREAANKPGIDFTSLKTLVEVLGGKIWVDNEPGQGAIFSILIPVTPQAYSGYPREEAGSV